MKKRNEREESYENEGMPKLFGEDSNTANQNVISTGEYVVAEEQKPKTLVLNRIDGGELATVTLQPVDMNRLVELIKGEESRRKEFAYELLPLNTVRTNANTSSGAPSFESV